MTKHQPRILPCRLALIGGVSFAVLSTARATEIVFDPTNFGVNVEQVVHHLEMIARLEAQIRNQYRMLENWRFTRLDELLGSLQAIRGALDDAGPLELARRYPIAPNEYARLDAEAMDTMSRQWLESQRETLVHAQTLQNRTVAEIPDTQRRVSEYVQRANDAPGQTAVLQASNETLATLAAQLLTLQALEVAQTRVELEEDAHRQALLTFRRQRRSALMKDWPVASEAPRPETAVRSAFAVSASR